MFKGEKMNRIITNPKILGGKPVIKGTRISVSLILDLLASGMSTEEIIKEYPHLKPADIQAATKYAAALIEKDRLILHPSR